MDDLQTVKTFGTNDIQTVKTFGTMDGLKFDNNEEIDFLKIFDDQSTQSSNNIVRNNYLNAENSKLPCDVAKVVDTLEEKTENSMVSKPPVKRRSSSCRSRVHFPTRLHEMLTECDKGEFSSVVSWCPHGRAFLVHAVEKFMREVLPKFFNYSKFTSFQRQLNSYGFRRFAKGADKGAYYHELFIRGRALDSGSFLRVKSKNDSKLDIDLYELPFIGSDGQELPKLSSTTNNEVMKPCVSHSNPSVNDNKTNKSFEHLKSSENLNSAKIKNFSEKLPLSCREKERNLTKSQASLRAKIEKFKILPLNPDNPLDQVEFFIPLDILLNA